MAERVKITGNLSEKVKNQPVFALNLLAKAKLVSDVDRVSLKMNQTSVTDELFQILA